jgi:hypothetical protein
MSLLVLGCGGGRNMSTSAGDPPPTMSGAETLRLTESFLQVEGQQAQPGYFPYTGQAAGGTPLAPSTPAGCWDATVDRSVPGTVKITMDFTGCPRGTAQFSGHVVVTLFLNPPGWTVLYSPLMASAGSQTWQLSGAKSLAIDPALMQANVQAQNLSVAYADAANPAANRTYTYGSNLTGSWASPGEFRVWGTWSLAANGETPVTATIARDQALVWAAGCCYPTAGTIRYTKGSASADATFLSSCGTVRITPSGGTPETRTLAACN